MNRALALLAGLLLATQVYAQPVAAAEAVTAGTSVNGQTEKTPRTPGGPDRPDDLTAGRIGDLKVELDSAWWVGTARHSKFKVSNVGDGTSYDVSVRKIVDTANPNNGDEEQDISYQALGDMPAGAFTYITVVCTPDAGWICDLNGLKGLTPGSDKNTGNNYAQDNV